MTRSELRQKLLDLGPELMAEALVEYIEDNSRQYEGMGTPSIGRYCGRYEGTEIPACIQHVLPEKPEPYSKE